MVKTSRHSSVGEFVARRYRFISTLFNQSIGDRVMRRLSVLLLAVTAACTAAAQSDPDLARARSVLSRTPLIDGHNDLPWAIREYAEAPHDVLAYDLTRRAPGHTDIARLREGMVGAQFWSVYIPSDLQAEDFLRVQLEQIDIAHRIIAAYPETFELASTADDVERIFAAGRIASLLGLEGWHAIANSLGVLRAYFELGARYMTLTHWATLDWADAATDDPRHDGLTAFGEEVVREMNWLGMLVDLSHVAPATMNDVLDVSRGAGHLLPLLGPRHRGPPSERARRHPPASAAEWRRGHGHLRAGLLVAGW